MSQPAVHPLPPRPPAPGSRAVVPAPPPVVGRWRQLPLDQALFRCDRVRALVQALADRVAEASGVGSSVVPDCGPATVMDQLTVMVHDASAAAATSTAGTSTLVADLASLRRELR